MNDYSIKASPKSHRTCIHAYHFRTTGVSPTVTRVQGNVPVLGLPSEVSVRPFESVANRPLPCKCYGSFILFKLSVSDFGTVGMHRQFCVCTYEFLTMVTEGVAHGVHKVMIRSSFGVIQRVVT